MKIGIIGVGHIGKTLALKLAAAGHQLSVANSGAPENINRDVLATGAKAVTAQEAVLDKEVIILSVPLNSIPAVAPLLSSVPENVTVIDTSNYYPARDQKIESLEAGLAESLWVTEQLGRPVAKAWNAIGSQSLERNGKPSGTDSRLAIPFAADRENDITVTAQLIEKTGFDAFYTGPIADSWRQQPGAPVYCTDLSLDEMQSLINKAEKERLPGRRDLAFAAMMERMSSEETNPEAGFALRLSRVLYI